MATFICCINRRGLRWRTCDVVRRDVLLLLNGPDRFLFLLVVSIRPAVDGLRSGLGHFDLLQQQQRRQQFDRNWQFNWPDVER